MKWKYVIAEVHGLETPIIFPEWVDHNSITSKKVVSAGFVTFIGGDKPWDTIYVSNEIEVICSGGSVTLQKKSRDEDADIIKRMLKSSLN